MEKHTRNIEKRRVAPDEALTSEQEEELRQQDRRMRKRLRERKAREEAERLAGTKTKRLLAAVEALADLQEMHDGHVTLLRFTTGWKATWGTVDLDTGRGRAETAIRQAKDEGKVRLVNGCYLPID